jgi:chromosome segregation ATPase
MKGDSMSEDLTKISADPELDKLTLILRIVQKLETHGDILVQIIGRLDKLTDLVDKLTNRVDKLTDRVDKLTLRIEAVEVRLNVIEARLDGIDLRLQSLEQAA